MAAVASSYLIRPMIVADIPHISEIERQSFPTMWPQTAYKRELQSNTMARYFVISDQSRPRAVTSVDPAGLKRQGGILGVLAQVAHGMQRTFGRASRETAPVPAAAVPAEEYLVAFLGLWFMLEECHVVTVAVREERRRQGIGELLVITAIELALQQEQKILTLECRVSNTGAQALYDKYGFRNVGVRKRYYTDNNEDAMVMTTPPIDTSAYQATFERLRAEHQQRWGVAQFAHPEL